MSGMARKKTSTFYVRGSLNIDNDGNFNQTEIDLGAYVNVLSKAVLSIKSIQWAFTDSNWRMPDITSGSAAAAQAQLTTQSQTAHVSLADKSLVGSNLITAMESGDGTIATPVSDVLDIGPMSFRSEEGYLVATESIFLGGSATSGWSEDVYVSVILECQVVTMDIEDGVALALSQQ